MGITWIIGILVIEVEELFALAYIYTIFVAFQGLFTFITCIVLDARQVREKFSKWWRVQIAGSDILNSRFFGGKSFNHNLSLVSKIYRSMTVLFFFLLFFFFFFLFFF